MVLIGFSADFLAGLRAAIDPHQIPSPIEVIEADKETWERTPYTTLPGSHVPLSTTEYVSIDQGPHKRLFIILC